MGFLTHEAVFEEVENSQRVEKRKTGPNNLCWTTARAFSQGVPIGYIATKYGKNGRTGNLSAFVELILQLSLKFK